MVKPVETRREQRIFLTFPWHIHRHDPLWIPPLMPQRRNRLDPQKNPVIAGGSVQPFIAWQDGRPAGTIVLAVDETRNRQWDEDNAIFGYFDCIEDYSVAEALLDTAVRWAREQGRSRLWGPWMLDYEDSHGFLIQGWDYPPVVMCAHNPPYYPAFAERYGLVKGRRDSLAFLYDVRPDQSSGIPEKLERVVQKLKQRSRAVVRTARFSEWDDEIARAVDVLNRGLAVLGESRGFWDPDRMTAHARSLRPVLDPDFVLFAEVDGEPVGWVMGLPDLNEAIRAANGLRHPWNMPQLWLAMRRRPTAISMKSIAVDPNYWNQGIDALLVHQFGVNALAKGYRRGDLSLTGEDNPMTPRLSTRLGAVEYKRYRIYEAAGWS